MAKSKNKYAALSSKKDPASGKKSASVQDVEPDINTPIEVLPGEGMSKKRRKLNNKKNKLDSKRNSGMSDSEKEWLDISISKPPPIPVETDKLKGNDGTAQKTAKKKNRKGKVLNIE
ncbi:hypothetical protein DSO57_1032776 [Entomophthora muscae]|uniref:Uncharacterized protein n=1 Tax=Entomophthora muscae TaxID=34485 RepID=A0ACC2U9B0_9FUNG|nr:hypothetical protein DSO57_1032776 [Entomophthora muscae]